MPVSPSAIAGEDKDVIVLVTYTDAAFVPHLTTMICSAGAHLAPSTCIRLFVLHAAVPADLQADAEASWSAYPLTVQWLDCSVYTDATFIPYAHVSIASFNRLLIGSLLPADVERALLIDSDAVVLADLTPLWRTDMRGNVAMCAIDAPGPVVGLSGSGIFELEGLPPETPYFNAGVILLDVAAWRRHGFEDESMILLARHPGQCRWGDQDILNVVLKTRWGRLDPAWNQQTYLGSYFGTLGIYDEGALREALERPRIVHFTGPVKPWHPRCPHPFRSRYLEFRARTTFGPAREIGPANSPGPVRRAIGEVVEQTQFFRSFVARAQGLQSVGLLANAGLTIARGALRLAVRRPIQALAMAAYEMFWRGRETVRATARLHALYWRVLGPFRRRAALGSALLAVAGLFEIGALLMIAPILGPVAGVGARSGLFDTPLFRAFDTGGALGSAWVQFLLLVSAGISSGLCRWRASRWLQRVRFDIEHHYRNDLVDRLMQMEWERFHTLNGGSISSSILSSFWHIGEGVEKYMIGASTFIVLVVLLGAAASVSPVFAAIAIGYAAVAAILSVGITHRASGWMKQSVAQNESLAVQAQQAVDNMKYIRVSGYQAWARAVLRGSFDQYRRSVTQQQRFAELSRLAIEFLGVMFIGLMLLAYRTLNVVDLPTFVAFTAMFYRVLPRIMNLEACRFGVRSKVGWIESWNDLAAKIGPVRDAPTRAGASVTLPRQPARIVFSEVTFAYRGAPATKVLDRVSFELLQGELLAVVGESGSGKSTFMDLLLGLIEPGQGTILVDGAPLATWGIQTWRQRLGYLPQEPLLFEGSVLENVAFGEESPDRAKVEGSLRAAMAWDFVTTLPGGIDGNIGERGGRLSGGQKQRLALARALYREPSVLLLDEPTSALDAKSAGSFKNVLASLKGRVTVVMITHQGDLLDIADAVLTLTPGGLGAGQVQTFSVATRIDRHHPL